MAGHRPYCSDWSSPSNGFIATLAITDTFLMSNDGGVRVTNFVKVLFENLTMTMTRGKAIELVDNTYGSRRT